MKTRKWTTRIFFHLLDVAMVNAYLLYQRLHKNTDQSNLNIDLPSFRSEVAESLCQTAFKRPVGRPAALEPPPPQPQKQQKTYIPSPDVRFDNVSHWCIFLDRSGKKTCKMPGCTSETQAFCTKCKLNLCNSTNKKCFFTFHDRK